ncbi:NAD(P)/FAD-dependent oxidoreductase [Bacillus sp. CGMCC 1.16607]|uniref:NAD(P)/FAD-dependent oxidoreductase n=1 Tax=Bacillus sp. CGMCC 1.16607 TaxID=3351842 RepID=UPI00362D323C
MKLNESNNSSLPIAIIGGGPVGLAAAAHLVIKGEKFVLFESGETIGSSILEWGHVRMFSPWQYNMDKSAKVLLEQTDWVAPNPDEIPNGKELVNKYLFPLSQLPEIQENIVLNAKVVGVAKKGLDKLKTRKREDRPFQIYVETDEETKVYEAKAVIDASGTWKNPNPMLSNGLWTKAERNLKDKIHYGIPNVLGDLEAKYGNKTVMVIGSGHSAINAILELAKLKEKHNSTIIHWVLRKTQVSAVYGGQERDGLPARGELGIRIQKLVESDMINVITPFYISEVISSGEAIVVKGEFNGEEQIIREIDEIIVSTGFRPDTSFLNEVRLNLDSAVESVEALAPLIDPNIHSCGTVRPHGEETLRQPEKGLYIVGMKSYGRAPTFLLATGYEQIRSIVAYLTGDFQGAKEVHLELPETGVCSTNIITSCCDESPVQDSNAISCCNSPISVKLEVKSHSCCG